MATFREESALADARKYASAAAYDIQQLPDDLVSQQALRNLLSEFDLTLGLSGHRSIAELSPDLLVR